MRCPANPNHCGPGDRGSPQVTVDGFRRSRSAWKCRVRLHIVDFAVDAGGSLNQPRRPAPLPDLGCGMDSSKAHQRWIACLVLRSLAIFAARVSVARWVFAVRSGQGFAAGP